MKNENYHRSSGISLTFNDNATTIEFNPKFKKTITTHTYSSVADVINKADALIMSRKPISFLSPMGRAEDWVQYCWFDLKIKNTGKKVIEDYKIELEFEGEFDKVGAEKPDVFNFKTFKSNVKGYSNSDRSLYIDPYETVLVPSDSYVTSRMYIQPKIGLQTKIVLKWKLLSRDFEDDGQLEVSIAPKYTINRLTNFVSQEELEGETEQINYIRRKVHPGTFGGFSDDLSDLIFE